MLVGPSGSILHTFGLWAVFSNSSPIFFSVYVRIYIFLFFYSVGEYPYEIMLPYFSTFTILSEIFQYYTDGETISPSMTFSLCGVTRKEN